jgi:MPBQ/MSBQ methyltransferase
MATSSLASTPAISPMLLGSRAAAFPRRAGAAVARSPARARRAFALPRASSSGSSPAAAGPSRMSVEDLAAPVLSSHGAASREVGQIAAGAVAAPPHASVFSRAFSQGIAPQYLAAAVLFASGVVVKRILDTPSRKYVQGPGEDSVGTVGEEYDAWTEEGILEHYWGEHIHLGYYSDEDMARGAGTLLGCRVKDFIEAKFDFVDKMLEWSECPPEPARVLDVGCGIGGTSRHLAKRLGPKSKVQGITLSPNQVKRATELAAEQGVDNASFQVMNALEMDFPDDTFDLVWACESGEHMPDKKRYVEEMIRVLKPGGTIVIATWCQRETPPEFTPEEQEKLTFLYEEWAHPYFVSIEEYVRLMEGTEKMATVGSANWVRETIRSWRHSIWVGVYDPWPVVFAGPRIWWKTIREIVTLERMHRAFDCDLMTYGMMKGKKAEKARADEKKAKKGEKEGVEAK